MNRVEKFYLNSGTLKIILCLGLFSNSFIWAQIDTVRKTLDHSSFIHIRNDTNTRLLVFLHGSLSNQISKDLPIKNQLDLMFEKNEDFVSTALKEGFNVVAPIANDSLNWLYNVNYCNNWIEKIIDSTEGNKSVYISGFSDGGTGSYMLFYEDSTIYDGLIVFNGFPQFNRYNETINDRLVKDKHVIFIATKRDNVIPYEFILTEYVKQKKVNSNTYLIINKGAHSFREYDEYELEEILKLVDHKETNVELDPLHGFVINNRLVKFYRFRRKIIRRYNYGNKDYFINKEQSRKVR